MASFLEGPAYKMTMKDLREAQDTGRGDDCWTLKIKSTDLVDNEESSLPYKELVLKLTMIWVQGTVTDFVKQGHEDEQPILQFSDSNGEEAIIYEYESIPGGNHPDIVKGAYIGVIGQLWSNKPTIVMKAAKIMCLSNPRLKLLWLDEIKDDRAYLLGITVPK